MDAGATTKGKEPKMTVIEVSPTQEGKWRITVDHVRRGSDLSLLEFATMEAEKIKTRHYPNAQVRVNPPIPERKTA